MKNSIIIISLLILFPLAIQADDDCALAMKEAKAVYGKGNYDKAKQLFEYIKGECGDNYEQVGVWIEKCDAAKKKQTTSTTIVSPKNKVKAKLQLSNKYMSVGWQESESFVTVTSNTTWSVVNNNTQMCDVSQHSDGIRIKFNTNYGQERSAVLTVRTTDGTGIENISLTQSACTQPATLSVSQRALTASNIGSTFYITVTSNRPWKVQYATGAWYQVTKTDSGVKVVINANDKTEARSDFFNIKTIDDAQTIRIDMSQPAKSVSSTSTSSYTSSPTRKNSYSSFEYYELSYYDIHNGDFELDWITLRTTFGTNIAFEFSTLGMRMSWFKLDPLVMGFRYDFIGKEISTTRYNYYYDYYHNYHEYSYTDYSRIHGYFYYQPTVKAYLPWDDEWAFTLGVAPTMRLWLDPGKVDWWFMVETAINYHWEDNFATDFFLRYDGGFSMGVSFNISSGF